MKKRPLTLTAGILGTVASALYTLLCLLATFGVGLLTDIGNSLEETTPGATAVFSFAMILMIILAGFCIAALVLNAVSIGGFACSAEKFAKKRGVIITAIVFNLLITLYILYSVFVSFSILNLVIGLVLAAASVLYIVDLCLEKNRVAQSTTSANTTQTTQTTQETTSQQNQDNTTNQA